MSLLERALISGTVAAAAVTLVVSLAGRRVTGSSAAPLNAAKFTASGFAANYGASVFWALLYEALPRSVPALVRGAAVSTFACVTDYHVVPKRLTPGFELRLPAGALAAAYAALALGLSARELLE